MSEVEEYGLALRYLRDVGELLSECRYHTATPKAVIDHAVRMEDGAKAWVAEAMRKMNTAILKR